MWERHTTVEVRRALGTASALQRLETNLVRKSVNRLWGWSGDLVVRGRGELGVTRSAVLLRSEWCELYRVGVEVH